jgi:hypothetical protein
LEVTFVNLQQLQISQNASLSKLTSSQWNMAIVTLRINTDMFPRFDNRNGITENLRIFHQLLKVLPISNNFFQRAGLAPFKSFVLC